MALLVEVDREKLARDLAPRHQVQNFLLPNQTNLKSVAIHISTTGSAEESLNHSLPKHFRGA